MFFEERSTIVVRRMTSDLKRMDGYSFDIHDRHMRDEVRRLVLTEELIRHYWDPASNWLKTLNLHLLKFFFDRAVINSYSAEKTWRVLSSRIPRLTVYNKEFLADLRELPNNRVYLNQILGRNASPRFWSQLQRRPETAFLRNYLDSITSIEPSGEREMR